KELMKIIDPTSMRFEAMVSADQVGAVKPGQSVYFRVNGYGNQEFAGKVRRVAPTANATTRQVELLVDFVGEKQPKLAGLYAEGPAANPGRIFSAKGRNGHALPGIVIGFGDQLRSTRCSCPISASSDRSRRSSSSSA